MVLYFTPQLNTMDLDFYGLKICFILSRSISRVLLDVTWVTSMMVIHLEFILLRISSNLPALLSMRKTSQSLFDLAPDGVYRSNQSLD